MTTHRSRLRQRLLAAVSAGALAVGALTLAASPAHAAPPAPVPATTTGSGDVKYVDNATFTWGVSGYAQKGIFGPWRFLGNTGNASLLSGATQTEYTVSPVPATSMPAAGAGVPANPNAVKFTAGTGAVDPATGAGKLSFSGSYTTNAYPANFNAPDETYTDPVLTIAADGSGTLTAVFALGAGVDQGGAAVPAQSFGRLTIADFAAGSLSNKTANGYRATPKYQGVEVSIPAEQTPQDRSCTTAGGATGWWGSWPQAFLTAMTSSPVGKSVAPHFYSTGCGGLQDNKPQLPVDVTYTADKPAPQVQITNTHVSAAGATTVTVSGTGFHAPLSVATRPPVGAGNAGAGSYVVFGKFGETWRPSTGAATGTRKQATNANGGLKWAIPAPYFGGPGLTPASGAVLMSPQGTFTTELVINKAALDAAADPTGFPANARYGIYTYGGAGASAASYETFTPVTFFQPGTSSVAVTANPTGKVGDTVPVEVTVTGEYSPSVATGAVTLTYVHNGGSPVVLSSTLGAEGKATFQLPSTLAAGAGTFTVAYAGDALFASATSTGAYTITKNTPTIGLDKDTPYTGPVGATIPVEVTVNGAQGKATPTGTVSLSGGVTVAPVALVDGKATISLPDTLTAGTGSFTVVYSGDGVYDGAEKASSYDVGKHNPTVTLDKTVPYAGDFGATIPVVVTVAGTQGTPTGSVTLKYTPAGGTEQTVSPSTNLVDGSATVTLPSTLAAGSTGPLTVSYSGDSTYNAGSKSSTYTVGKAAAAVALDKDAYTGTTGTAVPVEVTVSGTAGTPTGSVALTYTPQGGTASAPLSADLVAGKATISLPAGVGAGTGAITVSYAGSSTYATGADTATYTLAKRSSAITHAGPASVAYRTAATYTVAVSNGATGSVKITGAGTTLVRDLVNGRTTFVLPATLPAGKRTLKFEYAGSANHNAAAPVTKAITIAKGAVSISAKLTSRWTAVKAGKFSVTLTSVKGGPVPVGKVALTLRKGSVTKVVKAKVLANGRVVLTLPKSAKGTWAVKAVYAGSTQHRAATKTWNIRVAAK